MQNIKMIVTDMDGTLLRSDHTLSPKFKEIYNKLKEMGLQIIKLIDKIRVQI